MSSRRKAHSDRGYIFSGPTVQKRRKELKNGQRVIAYHQSGSMVSGNKRSPWNEAAFFAQGTAVYNDLGETVQEIALWETIDADGDMTWSILWRIEDGTESLALLSGTGKWKRIAGAGCVLPAVRERADEYFMPGWQIEWRIEKAPADEISIDESAFAHHDTCLSFHGPHIIDFTRVLSDGARLVVSSQSGVLLSEIPEAVSPRNYATNFDRGTTIQSAAGRALGDAMLLEDMDPDGDIAWLYHEWWYGEGPGTYRFIGGTGKWKGITGVGRTLGIVKERVDDHYMLKSEVFWNMAGE